MDDLSLKEQEIVIDTLRTALDRLTPEQTRCLLLQQLGLTQSQIGEILGIPQQSVSIILAATFHIVAHARLSPPEEP